MSSVGGRLATEQDARITQVELRTNGIMRELVGIIKELSALQCEAAKTIQAQERRIVELEKWRERLVYID